MAKEKEKQCNVVLTMPQEVKDAARVRSIEVKGDYRSLSEYVRDLIAYDIKNKIL